MVNIKLKKREFQMKRTYFLSDLKIKIFNFFCFVNFQSTIRLCLIRSENETFRLKFISNIKINKLNYFLK